MIEAGREGREGRLFCINPLMKVSKRNLPQKGSERALRALLPITLPSTGIRLPVLPVKAIQTNPNPITDHPKPETITP